MAYFEDLSRCDYFDHFGTEGKFIAVGWLDHLHSFSTGAVPLEVTCRLSDFLQDPWNLPLPWGYHVCEICRPEGIQLTVRPGESLPDREELTRELNRFGGFDMGVANLFIPVPGSDEIYAASSLIAHYIESHHYCPPIEFQQALLSCPPMNSERYFVEMRRRRMGQYC